MDGEKAADNEKELTSTSCGSESPKPLSTNKEEKRDSSDTLPTSSTDARTFNKLNSSVSDDPISSTSEMNPSEPKPDKKNADELDKVSVSYDSEAELMLMSMTQSEKVEENVDDLVNDLETLLGETAPPFNLPGKSEEKSTEKVSLEEFEDFLEEKADNEVSSLTEATENTDEVKEDKTPENASKINDSSETEPLTEHLESKVEKEIVETAKSTLSQDTEVTECTQKESELGNENDQTTEALQESEKENSSDTGDETKDDQVNVQIIQSPIQTVQEEASKEAGESLTQTEEEGAKDSAEIDKQTESAEEPTASNEAAKPDAPEIEENEGTTVNDEAKIEDISVNEQTESCEPEKQCGADSIEPQEENKELTEEIVEKPTVAEESVESSVMCKPETESECTTSGSVSNIVETAECEDVADIQSNEQTGKDSQGLGKEMPNEPSESTNLGGASTSIGGENMQTLEVDEQPESQLDSDENKEKDTQKSPSNDPTDSKGLEELDEIKEKDTPKSPSNDPVDSKDLEELNENKEEDIQNSFPNDPADSKDLEESDENKEKDPQKSPSSDLADSEDLEASDLQDVLQESEGQSKLDESDVPMEASPLVQDTSIEVMSQDSNLEDQNKIENVSVAQEDQVKLTEEEDSKRLEEEKFEFQSCDKEIPEVTEPETTVCKEKDKEDESVEKNELDKQSLVTETVPEQISEPTTSAVSEIKDSSNDKFTTETLPATTDDKMSEVEPPEKNTDEPAEIDESNKASEIEAVSEKISEPTTNESLEKEVSTNEECAAETASEEISEPKIKECVKKEESDKCESSEIKESSLEEPVTEVVSEAIGANESVEMEVVNEESCLEPVSETAGELASEIKITKDEATSEQISEMITGNPVETEDSDKLTIIIESTSTEADENIPETSQSVEIKQVENIESVIETTSEVERVICEESADNKIQDICDPTQVEGVSEAVVPSGSSEVMKANPVSDVSEGPSNNKEVEEVTQDVLPESENEVAVKEGADVQSSEDNEEINNDKDLERVTEESQDVVSIDAETKVASAKPDQNILAADTTESTHKKASEPVVLTPECDSHSIEEIDKKTENTCEIAHEKVIEEDALMTSEVEKPEPEKETIAEGSTSEKITDKSDALEVQSSQKVEEEEMAELQLSEDEDTATDKERSEIINPVPEINIRRKTVEQDLEKVVCLSEESSDADSIPPATIPTEEEPPFNEEADLITIAKEVEQLEELPKDADVEPIQNEPAPVESSNLETIMAVASLQQETVPSVSSERRLSEKEMREMEAIRMAVASITDSSQDTYDNYMEDNSLLIDGVQGSDSVVPGEESTLVVNDKMAIEMEATETEVYDDTPSEVQEEVKIDAKEETKEVKEGTSTEVNEEIAADVREEVKEVEEMATEVKEGLTTEVNKEIAADVREEVKEVEEMATEVKKSLTTAVNEEIAADVREEVKVVEEMTTEVKEDLTTEINEEVAAEVREELKEVKEETTTAEIPSVLEEDNPHEIKHKTDDLPLSTSPEINEVVETVGENLEIIPKSSELANIADKTVPNKINEKDSKNVFEETATKDAESLSEQETESAKQNEIVLNDSQRPAEPELPKAVEAEVTSEVKKSEAESDDSKQEVKIAKCDEGLQKEQSVGSKQVLEINSKATTSTEDKINAEVVTEVTKNKAIEASKAKKEVQSNKNVKEPEVEKGIVQEPVIANDKIKVSVKEKVTEVKKSCSKPQLSKKEEEVCNSVKNIEKAEVPEDGQGVSQDAKEEKVTNAEKVEEGKPLRGRLRRGGTGKVSEPLSISVDETEKEKVYSPKITIKPVKALDEEVSTTSDADANKGSLKITITKQSDKMHSILKVYNPDDDSETVQGQEEPIPKLIIKPKIQQVEQQHSPKMCTRSSKTYSPTGTRCSSPRITIKPIVKAAEPKAEASTPIKITFKPVVKPEETTTKKHSPKISKEGDQKNQNPKITIKPIPKPAEEDTSTAAITPKVTIKPIKRPLEDPEPEERSSPKIIIKPIVKPTEQDQPEQATPKLKIKAIRRQNEENELEKEQGSPKISIKSVKPPEDEVADEEVKERIVLKINKGNLPTPTKDPKKREYPEDDKAEKAGIKLKFSTTGGHTHIVQENEESNKRQRKDSGYSGKDLEENVSHKRALEEKLPERNKRLRNTPDKLNDNSNDVKVHETKNNLPLEMSEDSRSQNIADVTHDEESPSFSRHISKISDIASRTTHIQAVPQEITVGVATPTTLTPVSLRGKRRRPRGRPPKMASQSRQESIKTSPLTPQTHTVMEEVVSTPPVSDVRTPEATPSPGRPKRSCRTTNVIAVLGIKPKKTRGGRGAKVNMGDREPPPPPPTPELPPKPEKPAKSEKEVEKNGGGSESKLMVEEPTERPNQPQNKPYTGDTETPTGEKKEETKHTENEKLVEVDCKSPEESEKPTPEATGLKRKAEESPDTHLKKKKEDKTPPRKLEVTTRRQKAQQQKEAEAAKIQENARVETRRSQLKKDDSPKVEPKRTSVSPKGNPKKLEPIPEPTPPKPGKGNTKKSAVDPTVSPQIDASLDKTVFKAARRTSETSETEGKIAIRKSSVEASSAEQSPANTGKSFKSGPKKSLAAEECKSIKKGPITRRKSSSVEPVPSTSTAPFADDDIIVISTDDDDSCEKKVNDTIIAKPKGTEHKVSPAKDKRDNPSALVEAIVKAKEVDNTHTIPKDNSSSLAETIIAKEAESTDSSPAKEKPSSSIKAKEKSTYPKKVPKHEEQRIEADKVAKPMVVETRRHSKLAEKKESEETEGEAIKIKEEGQNKAVKKKEEIAKVKKEIVFEAVDVKQEFKTEAEDSDEDEKKYDVKKEEESDSEDSEVGRRNAWALMRKREAIIKCRAKRMEKLARIAEQKKKRLEQVAQQREARNRKEEAEKSLQSRATKRYGRYGEPKPQISLIDEPVQEVEGTIKSRKGLFDPLTEKINICQPIGVDEDDAAEKTLERHLTKAKFSAPEADTADNSPKKVKSLAAEDVVMLDEDTRMSADFRQSAPSTPAKQTSNPSDIVEDSQGSLGTEGGKSRSSKGPKMDVFQDLEQSFTADQLAEYSWKGQGPFMIQEQVSHFLGIKSFKRKYPNIPRRPVDMQERDYLKENAMVTEAQCDLGLTAVIAQDILDIMYSDFQDKYEEYCRSQREKQARELAKKQKALSMTVLKPGFDKLDLLEQAIQSAASWNQQLNKSRREERRTHMDLQTFTIHYPKSKMKVVNTPKIGHYPVALVPGQFTDYYHEYTPTELNNLPLNTMCYDEIKPYVESECSASSSDSGSEPDSDSSSSYSSCDDKDCKDCQREDGTEGNDTKETDSDVVFIDNDASSSDSVVLVSVTAPPAAVSA
ncbi:microtubule-associated protein futsch-like isoform X2 [Anthonomus grandis grandis]|uniref:microtubule-associated protein futsch-like isoform X2 n=1 Tax=Anthonomus grandis grandis TaxID=2921223 RepID=UPI002165528A|nr:microtubule-associated protein futsch-like isoform X2 [Anthonomus grandis grandis]